MGSGGKKRRCSRRQGGSSAAEDDRLVETRRRSEAINSYVDLIPARFYLATDNPAVMANKGLWDPAKTKTTSQLVAEAAAAAVESFAEGAAGEAAAGEGGANAACGAKMTKAARRRLQRRGGKTAEEAAAARQQRLASGSADTRAELHAKLERRIAELKEERRRRQSEKDKARAAQVRAEQEGKGGKGGEAPRRPTAAAAGGEDGSASKGPDIGRLNFDGAVTQPFEAGVGRRGDKVRRLRAELRKQEHDDERLRRAGEQGKGEELRQELALQKALRRARGEKVHDDSSKLRKAQKALEGKKRKSKDRWDTLKDAQKRMLDEKQDRRKENLAKPRGKKRKLRNGFEGQRGGEFLNSDK